MKETQDQRSSLTLAVKYSYLYPRLIDNHSKLKNKNRGRIFLRFSFEPPDGAGKFGAEESQKSTRQELLLYGQLTSITKKLKNSLDKPVYQVQASGKLFFSNLNERNWVGPKFLLNPKYVVL